MPTMRFGRYCPSAIHSQRTARCTCSGSRGNGLRVYPAARMPLHGRRTGQRGHAMRLLTGEVRHYTKGKGSMLRTFAFEKDNGMKTVLQQFDSERREILHSLRLRIGCRGTHTEKSESPRSGRFSSRLFLFNYELSERLLCQVPAAKMFYRTDFVKHCNHCLFLSISLKKSNFILLKSIS